MKALSFLLPLLTQNIAEGQELDWCKCVLPTSIMEIQSYPAIVVELSEGDSVDFESIGKGTIISSEERYDLSVLVESSNRDEITSDNYIAGIDDVISKFKSVVSVIAKAMITAQSNGIGSLVTGKAGVGYAFIGSKPVIIITAQITFKTI